MDDRDPEIPCVQTIITAAGYSATTEDGSPGTVKGLTRIDGVPILRRAVDSYVVDPSRAVVALNMDEERDFGVSRALAGLDPAPTTVFVSSRVQGALATAVFAAASIQRDSPLVVAGGDSEIQASISDLVSSFLASEQHAATIVFPSTEPRWSYLAVTEDGMVSHVAEKKVVGPLATTGVFLFRQASDFLEAAEWCFAVNAKTNDRFYVSTTLNHLILRGLNVGYLEIQRERYHSWALPSDLLLG